MVLINIKSFFFIVISGEIVAFLRTVPMFKIAFIALLFTYTICLDQYYKRSDYLLIMSSVN